MMDKKPNAFKTDILLDTHETSEYTGIPYNTLKQARTYGEIFDMPAPKFVKIGRNVRYKKSTLDAWAEKINNMPEYQTTAEVKG